MTELVHYDVADGVATLTLDSPHNRNALSKQLVAELYDGLGRAEEDAAVKVVLIRAEGRTFCSGADLSEAAGEGMEKAAGVLVDLQRRIVTLAKPVVTRVHGNVRSALAYLRGAVGGLKHYGGGLFHIDTGPRRPM